MARDKHYVNGDDMDNLNKESRIRKEKLRQKAKHKAELRQRSDYHG